MTYGRFCTVSLAAILLTGCFDGPDQVALLPSRNEQVLQRGEQMVHGTAACGFCHGSSGSPFDPLSGGRELADSLGKVESPNITPSSDGIGPWSMSEIYTALRGGERPDGSLISSELHKGMNWISDPDLYAIASYLKAVPAVENQVERREIDVTVKAKVALLESRPLEVAFVPELPRNAPMIRGAYLVDNLSRCITCHNGTSSGLFGSSERYLGGGREVYIEGVSRVAPNISGSAARGIGSWSEEQIVRFLSSGKKPGGEVIDQRFCPVEFFARAAESDKQAIARYLKSVEADS